MAAKGMGSLAEAMGALRVSKPCVSRTFTRCMATEAPVEASRVTAIANSWHPTMTVPLTIHKFPTLEPSWLEEWSVQHLYLPMRRDLLHLAVVYEGDATRQGTASSKTRYEVAGGNRKMRPQKGSGRSRMGDRKSPLLRGGGKTFGPKPRDFATGLTRKTYDKAWRTALSYRYRRGELIICEDGMELSPPAAFDAIARVSGPRADKEVLRDGFLRQYVGGMLGNLGLGSADGRTLFVTEDRRDLLFRAMESAPEQGRALGYADVDVKDLLETGHLVVERSVLKEMIERHQSDLVARIVVNGVRARGPAIGDRVVG